MELCSDNKLLDNSIDYSEDSSCFNEFSVYSRLNNVVFMFGSGSVQIECIASNEIGV